jgi:hypothetical protein
MLRQPYYLVDLLILKDRNFKEHLLNFKIVLERLSNASLKVNNSKSKFYAEQIEYVGSWIREKVLNLYVTRLK